MPKMRYFLEKAIKIAEALGIPSLNHSWLPAAGTPLYIDTVLVTLLCCNNLLKTNGSSVKPF